MNDFLRNFLHLPQQASNFAKSVDYLHYFVFLTTMVMFVIMGGATVYFIFRFRALKEKESTPLVIPSIRFELGVISAPMFLFFLWFGIGYRDFVWMNTPPKDATDVYVMGKKWMWKFAYPEGPNAVGTLRVPVGRPIRLLITSRDVIHSFFVPDFRIKIDALPGRYTQAWFVAEKAGKYPIYCAEFCGTLHSSMWGDVIAMEPRDFDDWLQAQKNGHPVARDGGGIDDDFRLLQGNMVEQGKRLANVHGCLKCHSTDGERHLGPTWVGMWGRKSMLADGSEITVDEGYMTESMMDPLAKVVAGYAPIMPPYRGKLAAPEAAALVEYIKSLRGPAVPSEAKGPGQ